MDIKKGLKVYTDDFWYDLAHGGYIHPTSICVKESDAMKVLNALAIIQDFEDSCEEQIGGFIQ